MRVGDRSLLPNLNQFLATLSIPLYRHDPYLREFDSTVTKVGDAFIVLDRTCFYPQGGGQVGDTGEISGVNVSNTINVDGEIRHIVDASSFRSGQKVHAAIDWERRLRIMRLHSASHIVSYIMREVFGAKCKPASSGMIDDAKDRTDYLFDEPLDREKLGEVEVRVNMIIEEARPIRHMSEGTGDKVIWTIDGFTSMPCGGTHVRNTSEIGRIALKRGSKPGRGKERIEITLISN